jgi:hypothetical protein
MIASAINAFPNGHTLDADDVTNQQYRLTFRGDRIAAMLINTFDLRTMDKLSHRAIEHTHSDDASHNHGFGKSDNDYRYVRPVVAESNPINKNGMTNVLVARTVEEGNYYNGDIISQVIST